MNTHGEGQEGSQWMSDKTTRTAISMTNL